MKLNKHDPKCEERPITAQAIGSEYWVETRGDQYRESDSISKSYNVMPVAPGCFRRLPTYID